jgi:hypothetical protein
MGYEYYGRDRKEMGDILMIDEGGGTQKSECSNGRPCFVLV